jgi:hypothetical protein
MDPELQHLLHSASPANRTALYLRLLYSPSCAQLARSLRASGDSACHAQTLAFLQSVDFDRLALEQRARLRNLAHHLSESFAYSWPVLEPALRRELVERFVDEPAFWRFTGRSLAESFAVVAWQVLRARRCAFLADLVRLEGVLSGLLAGSTAPAPWQALPDADHEHVPDAAAGPTERFPSQWQLLDDNGELPTPARAGELMARVPSHHRLSLTLEPDGVEISCVRLAT